MRHHRLAILTTLFVTLQTLVIQAQNASPFGGADKVLSECLLSEIGSTDISSCFGTVLAVCETHFPDAVVVPLECWEQELAVWNRLLDSTYQALIKDLKQRAYGEFEASINEAQRHWIAQKDMDCRLEVASTPQTYDVIWPACQAEASMHRVAFLRDLTGADWTPY